jgi:hypothetical protein
MNLSCLATPSTGKPFPTKTLARVIVLTVAAVVLSPAERNLQRIGIREEEI